MSLAVSDMGRSAWAEPEFERLSPVLGGLLAHCGGLASGLALALRRARRRDPVAVRAAARWLSEHRSGRGRDRR